MTRTIPMMPRSIWRIVLFQDAPDDPWWPRQERMPPSDGAEPIWAWPGGEWNPPVRLPKVVTIDPSPYP